MPTSTSDYSVFDPYTDTFFPVRAVAALHVGRCTARLSWHLQQAPLLTSSFSGEHLNLAVGRAWTPHDSIGLELRGILPLE